MEITMAGQTRMFLLSIGLGAALGVLWDILRVVRVAVRHSASALFVEDVAFALVCAGATFVFQTHEACGEIRGFALIGEAVGFTLYYCTVGVVVMGAARTIAAFCHRVGAWVNQRFWTPVGRSLQKNREILRKNAQKTSKFAKKTTKNLHKYLQKYHGMVYNLRNPACHAAGDDTLKGKDC